MSFPRARDFCWDLTAGRLVSGPNALDSAAVPVLTQGDKFLLRFHFYTRSGIATSPLSLVTLDAGFQIVFAARPKDDLESGELLFSAVDFAQAGDGDNLHYEALLDLNTVALAAPLTGKKSIIVAVDLEIQNADNTERVTVPQVQFQVDRQVYRGTEGVPVAGPPPYPSPAALLTRMGAPGVCWIAVSPNGLHGIAYGCNDDGTPKTDAIDFAP